MRPRTTMPIASSLAGRLIRHAARRTPRLLSERLEEEWLADLADIPFPFRRLRFALDCHWAALVIAHEHGGTSARPEAPPAGSRTLTLELQSLLPRHTGALALVLCAHGVALHLLVTHLLFHSHAPDMPVVVTLQPGAQPLQSPLTPDMAGARVATPDLEEPPRQEAPPADALR